MYLCFLIVLFIFEIYYIFLYFVLDALIFCLLSLESIYLFHLLICLELVSDRCKINVKLLYFSTPFYKLVKLYL